MRPRDRYNLSSSLDQTLEEGFGPFEDTLGHGQTYGYASKEHSEELPSDLAGGQGPSENNQRLPRGPFSRWVRSLHRRAECRPSVSGKTGVGGQLFEITGMRKTPFARRSRRFASSTGSSFGFVANMRSASVSLVSASSAGRFGSRKGTPMWPQADRSSRASLYLNRTSEDSTLLERSVQEDKAAAERAVQRRLILEELIATEESYVRDLRFLINVFVTMLAPLPSHARGLRTSFSRNLNEILELHEEILGELHRRIPFSEYSHCNSDQPASLPGGSTRSVHKVTGHKRWRSLDTVPENGGRCALIHRSHGLLAEPQTAAEVADIFIRRLGRFFVYEEYGAKHGLVAAEIHLATQPNTPGKAFCQRGIEALASTLEPSKQPSASLKRASTLDDLLMKPVQRVTKYPLLFDQLARSTTAADCPNSHMEVDTALFRLQEATLALNRNTNDPNVRAVLEKTWLLQDRLVFSGRRIDAMTKNQVRGFGRIQLCGALHVIWSAADGVKGRYVISLLYKDMLCLAWAGKVDQIYTIMLCVNLDDARVETTTNDQGLQCQTAPFSWKLVFECGSQLYEIIMTACSQAEEESWRSHLTRIKPEAPPARHQGASTSLELDIKSFGSVLGKDNKTARRDSISRACTVGARRTTTPVILRNTCAAGNGRSISTSNVAINRSQSLLTTNFRQVILAPPAAERIRLESILADVWTRDTLPFPGITGRARNDHLIRATSMMRKLSMVGITDPFSKRSMSMSMKSAQPMRTDKGQIREEPHEPGIRGTANQPLRRPKNEGDDLVVKRPRMREAATCPVVPTKLFDVTVHKPGRPDLAEGLRLQGYNDEGAEGPGEVLRKSSTNSVRTVSQDRATSQTTAQGEENQEPSPAKPDAKNLKNQSRRARLASPRTEKAGLLRHLLR
ncbi:uncharacterized protein F5Z01DRAFT_623577 [Emericellopsis atlantica]|uniref:DH domain-containing protein n=1 Tax=Emericellopsis atlantica TaxID=2614577 RepID=A0A9P7ZKH9_9HYPO|nr:uncharacterized protein F5Z01DRAFT_623577 [Emericellopsis atlantica]KAG9253616.1 hypothetical protein F5Z01DRAFT_623577 [Emericellopsis atlantica]